MQTKFPKIEVCLTPGLDLDYLQSIGYASLVDFANGEGKHNGRAFYGWNGYETTGIKNVFENAFLFKNFRTAISEFHLFLGDENISEFVNIIERNFRFPDGKCFDFKINISSKYDYSFGKVMDLELILEDRNATARVSITDPYREYFLSDVFTFSGKEIKKTLNPEIGHSYDIYKLQILQNIHSEDDKEANCKEYTSEEKGSFKECVKFVVEEKFLKKFGCMPPWFTENIAYMCNLSLSYETWKNMKGLETKTSTFY